MLLTGQVCKEAESKMMQHLYRKPFRAETTLQGTSVIQQVALFPVTFEPIV